MKKFSKNLLEGKPERRGTQTRLNDARIAHRLHGSKAGIAAYCAGNRWATENARAVGNL